MHNFPPKQSSPTRRGEACLAHVRIDGVMNKPPSDTRIGEVVKASTREFTAQCYELFQPPPLGSLVKTGQPGDETFALVYEASTSSIDPGRTPIALGKDTASEEDIYQAHPQLPQLLRTDFRALVVGHRQQGKLRRYLPAMPARVHAFVYLCSDTEVKEFTASLDFIASLLESNVSNKEEAIAAFLRRASAVQDDSQDFLVKAGKLLANLLAGDSARLNTLLKRMRP